MMQYLIILLDNASASYCHYQVNKPPKAIDLETLRKGIRYAMMENLMIQFVYPDTPLNKALALEIETIDHHKLIPSVYPNGQQADVVLYESISQWLKDKNDKSESLCVVRTDKDALFAKAEEVNNLLISQKRLNLILRDIDSFTEQDFNKYESLLDVFSSTITNAYLAGKNPQINLLTDRLILKQMNNCQAGVENITLAPNGKFYICPAFYYEDEADSVGDLNSGDEIKNSQLYKLEYAPICHHCDAYQCRRCVWLNRQTTLEVNTPSHEQCVVAHLERNASRKLLEKIKESSGSIPEWNEIEEISYLDPFDIRNEF